MANYIADLRALVGHKPLIMNSASGALLNDAGEVLLQERADTGNWGFPGGYMEFGETFKMTVQREFMEDAGIHVEPVKLLKLSDDFQYEYPNGDQVQPVNCFYLVEYRSGHVLQEATDETTRLQYFRLDQPPTFFNNQHAEMFEVLKESR